MALKLFGSTLHKAFTRGTAVRTLMPRSTATLYYSTASKANENLLKVVNTELKLEGADFHKLPEVTAFACSIDGAIATFTRKLGNEEVMVTLDSNSTAELDTTEDFVDDEDEAEEDSEMELQRRAPAFTVSITKPSGNLMQFECSFNVDYGEIQIDSVSVVPKDCEQADSVYYVDGSQLGKDLYSSLEHYLEERGISKNFSMELLGFYDVFEHRVYVTNFLEGIKKFCSE